MAKTSDKELISRYLKVHDEKALEQLIYRHTAAVYGLVRVFTADEDRISDIVQDTFVKIWRNLKRFDQKRDFKTWMFAIARNTAIDYLKKKQAIPFSVIEAESGISDFADDLPCQAPSVLDSLVLQEAGEQIRTAMSRLPAGYGSVISLHVNDGLTFHQISERLSKPIDTIKSQYRRGVLKLRKILE